MFARHERFEAFAGLGDDAATIREADQHAVPFEIAQLRIMQVEENFGALEESIAFFFREITAHTLCLRETERHKTQVTIVLREEIRITRDELFAQPQVFRFINFASCERRQVRIVPIFRAACVDIET